MIFRSVFFKFCLDQKLTSLNLYALRQILTADVFLLVGPVRAVRLDVAEHGRGVEARVAVAAGAHVVRAGEAAAAGGARLRPRRAVDGDGALCGKKKKYIVATRVEVAGGFFSWIGKWRKFERVPPLPSSIP